MMANYEIGYIRKPGVAIDKADIVIKRSWSADQFDFLLLNNDSLSLMADSAAQNEYFRSLNKQYGLHNGHGQVVICKDKIKQLLSDYQARQEVYEKTHWLPAFFQKGLITDYSQDGKTTSTRTRTLRQRIITGIALTFTLVFALTCVLSAAAGLAFALSPLLGITMPVAFAIGVASIGFFSGLVNYRLVLQPCLQIFQDIFGGVSSVSKKLTEMSDGTQMDGWKRLALFAVGLLSLVAGVTAGALWFLVAYHVLPLIMLPAAAVIPIAVAFATFHAITVGFLILKSGQTFVADKGMATPLTRIYRYFADLKDRLRHIIRKGLAEKGLISQLETYTNVAFGLAIAFGLVIVALVVVGLSFMIFKSALSGLVELFQLLAGSSLGAMAALKIVAIATVVAGFMAELILYMGTAFSTAESAIISCCQSWFKSSQSQDNMPQTSNAVYMVLRVFNAVANGILGVSAVLISIAGGVMPGFWVAFAAVWSVIGNSFASFVCADSGMDKGDVAAGRFVDFDVAVPQKENVLYIATSELEQLQGSNAVSESAASDTVNTEQAPAPQNGEKIKTIVMQSRTVENTSPHRTDNIDEYNSIAAVAG